TRNLFLVLVHDHRAPLKYVSGLRNMRVVDQDSVSSKATADDLAWCDCLVVHYLGIPGAKLILRVSDRTVVAWSGWGGDYNDLVPDSKTRLVGEATRRLVSISEGALRRPVMSVPRSVWTAIRVLRRWLFVGPLLRKAIRRADLFSAPIAE